MPEYQYQCVVCGTERPVGVAADDESELPDELEAICGERWGGCGEVQTLRRPGTAINAERENE